jgi:hypothetical protein
MSTAASSTEDRALLKTMAPVVVMGATWAARKGMVKAYEAKTGRHAPVVRSRESSVVTKVLWAAALAGVVALIEIVVWQVLDDQVLDDPE